MLKKYILLCNFLLAASALLAQSTEPIVIETKTTALVLKTGAKQKLFQAYFGPKLADYKAASTTHQAYIPAGGDDLFEPAIQVTHADGNPSLYLQFESTKKETVGNVTHTSITLKDPQYPVEVTLHYKAYYNEDVITGWTEIVHHEAQPITLTNIASNMLHFNAAQYWLTQFHGDWAQEQKMVNAQLTSGIKVLDTKLTTRSQMYQSPFFMVSLNKSSTENEGEVLMGTLAWSGNFRFAFEVDNDNALRIISGINPFASAYTLVPNQSFTSPEFIFTYSTAGRGQGSRNMHNWARKYGIADGEKPRLTLLNNWETTLFDFTQQQLDSLIGSTATLGLDVFLLDDGWFGNKYPRNNDKSALGDWQLNKTKLPGGISHLVSEAKNRGVKFGIWVEPEMVSPKSVLYETHPDWVAKLPNREEVYYRNQLVLDLSNPAVQEHVFHVLDDILTQNPGLAFFKWDCNAVIYNAWSPYEKYKSNFFIDYVKGLYKVMDRVTAKYPHLNMMLCSGGGSRLDYGALKHFTEFWASDNTDGLERVYMQWGYSHFYPANAIAAHVTSWGKQSLKFRTDVAMMDKLGYDINVSHFTPDELNFTKEAVSTYKRLSGVISQGDLYRLVSPYEQNRAVLMYASADKKSAVLFSYTLNLRFHEDVVPVVLQGLDEHKTYKLTEVNLYPGIEPSKLNGKTYSGEFLMKAGLPLSSLTPLSSAVFELTAVD